MEEFNPYQFLNVPENITLADFKKVCVPLLSKYHPDKGGKTEHFQKIKQAIKIITTNIKTGSKYVSAPKTHMELKKTNEMILPDASPSEFFNKSVINVNSAKEFNLETFNEKFEKTKKTTDFILVKEKEPEKKQLTREEYLLERSKQNDEFSSTKKLFEEGKFDTNVFNSLYLQTNKTTELKEYKDPVNLALNDHFSETFTPFNPIGSISTSGSGSGDFDAYNGSHYNGDINSTVYNTLKLNKITDASIVTQEERMKMKEKLNDFSNVPQIVNNGESIPAPIVIAKGTPTDLTNDYKKKLDDRNMLPIPERNERNERNERVERNDRVDRVEKIERVEKVENIINSLTSQTSQTSQSYNMFNLPSLPLHNDQNTEKRKFKLKLK